MNNLSRSLIVMFLFLLLNYPVFADQISDGVVVSNSIIVGEVTRNNQILTFNWGNMSSSGKVNLRWFDITSGKETSLITEIKNG